MSKTFKVGLVTALITLVLATTCLIAFTDRSQAGTFQIPNAGQTKSPADLYLRGMTSRETETNYDSWKMTVPGSEVVISSLPCNARGAETLLLGYVLFNDKTLEGCWRYKNNKVQFIVKKTQIAEEFHPELFKPSVYERSKI